MPARMDIDIEEIERLYVKEKLTCRKIAERFGVSRRVIILRLRETGHRLRTSADYHRVMLDLQEIERLYVEEKLSCRKIAECFGVNPAVIILRLRERGHKDLLRTSGDYRRVKLDLQEIERLYFDEGLSCLQIGKLLCASSTTIRRRLVEAGRALRTKPEALRGERSPMYGRRGPASPWYGKRHSEETRKKMSVTLRAGIQSGRIVYGRGEMARNWGMRHSAEVRRRMSEAKKGRFVGEKSYFWGKHHSEETRKKLSEKMKGRYAGVNNPMYGRRGPLAPSFGRKHTEEERRKISARMTGEKHPMYGKPRSERLRRLQSERMSGPKHPLFRNWASRKPYGAKWSPERRHEVRVRDGYNCQICGKKVSVGTVHHLNYNKKVSHPSNLITLCVYCHSRTTPTNRDYWFALCCYLLGIEPEDNLKLRED